MFGQLPSVFSSLPFVLLSVWLAPVAISLNLIPITRCARDVLLVWLMLCMPAAVWVADPAWFVYTGFA